MTFSPINVATAVIRPAFTHTIESVTKQMGSYCSIRTAIVPPPARKGNVPTPITSPLPAEKHFHTHVKGAEHRAVKFALLKSAHFTFLIRNSHAARGVSHKIITYQRDAE